MRRFALVAALLVAACGASSRSSPATVTVASSALITAPIAVTIRGVPANATVVVTAATRDYAGNQWQAQATYRASSSGIVSLGQAPVSAGYTGANPMGLVETMASAALDGEVAEFSPPAAGARLTFTARVGGRVVATGSTLRLRMTPGVTERHYRPSSGGVYGNVFTPSGTGRRTAVIAWGGSEGGMVDADLEAAQFASRGYPSLALAYFGEPGLPATLASVPLEYFARALALLRAQPDVARVVVVGLSRGGEAALLVSSYFPSLVDAVFAGVPSPVVNGGYPDYTRPAWTLDGRALPSVPASAYRYPDVAARVPAADIPVERIRGPVILDCGGYDRVWNSCSNVAQITARFTARHFAHPVTALRYPQGGHLVGLVLPYQPLTTDILTKLGGTRDATLAGQLDASTHLLQLLATLG